MPSSKKHKKHKHKKHKESRRESSESESDEKKTSSRHHKKHHRHHHEHKERKREKHEKVEETISDSDDDVIYVPSPSPPPMPVKVVPTPPSKVPTPSKKVPPAPSSSSSSSKTRRPTSPAKSSPPSQKQPPTELRHQRQSQSTSSKKQPERSPSPSSLVNPNRSGVESLSIAETDALRAKLGLKPLTKTDSMDGGQKEKALDFVHVPAVNIGDQKFSEKIRERLNVRKEKRLLEKKLGAVKTLAEESDGEDNALSWVEKSRKLEEARKKAELKAKELDEMDEVFGIGDLVKEDIKKEKEIFYTARNLRGLKVEHDVESFTEGKSVILTLKDKGVLDEEDDALVNVNMVDNEKYKKNILNKKQKPSGYNAIDSGEFEEESKGVLTKYDEEIDGEKKTSFTIGEERDALDKIKVKNKLQEKAKMKLESLALPEMKLASEYYSPDELQIKKLKKKKKVRKRILKADELLALGTETSNHFGRRNGASSSSAEVKTEQVDDPMELDDVVVPALVLEEIKVEEDDTELELALRKARRLKAMPIEANIRKLPKVEEVLAQVKEDPDDTAPVDAGSSIVLNSTAEFCRTLGDIPTYGLAGNRDEEPDVVPNADSDKASKKRKRKREETTEETGGWNEAPTADERRVEIAPVETPILDAEPNLGAGVSGALRLAVSKGYLEKETTSRPSASRFAHLAAQNYSIDDKAHQVEDERQGRRERYLGPTLDFKEKDAYKPNIKLEYIDDDGHLLSAKEAFRYLSHKFHGKGPGKNKVEKRMKKSEQEGLMKQMSSTDTPLGTLQMLQHKQKESQSPFIVLSGSKQTNLGASISKMKMMK